MISNTGISLIARSALYSQKMKTWRNQLTINKLWMSLMRRW